jgi:hypothetical protein
MTGNPSPGCRSIAIFSTMGQGPDVAANLAELGRAMQVHVVYPADRFDPCQLDDQAYGWHAGSEPGWMADTRSLCGRNPCWHKAEVAFLHVWRQLRPSVTPDLKWVWCTEYDVACDDWQWLEEKASKSDVDLLGSYLKLRDRAANPVTGSMLLTCFRASVRLMDHLVEKAEANRQIFCERVVATAPFLAGMPYQDWLKVDGLAELYTRKTMRPRPAVIRGQGPAPRMWHPVKPHK